MCLASGGATGERSSSGLLEWESINDSMEALAMMNHYQMKNPSKYSDCDNNTTANDTNGEQIH